MRTLLCTLVALILILPCACSEETEAPRDAAPEAAVDRGIFEGPITRPVEDAFVPLDGPVDAALPQEAAPGDAGPE